MWPYWIMFLVPALLATQEQQRQTPRARGALDLASPSGWLLVAFAFCLMIGLRFEVGGDWQTYLENIKPVARLSLGRILTLDDPGYHLLEWLSLKAGWSVYGVNLAGAAIFTGGLFRFCRFLPRPWLALAAAVPYLVIVLGMGYTRQGMALGCALVGLVAFANGKVLRFVLWIVIGATFHKTAILLLPFAALASSQRRIVTALWVAAVTFTAYVLLLADSVEILRRGYLEAKYESQGALVRLLMNVVPALIFLVRRRSFELVLPAARMWFWFSIASLLLLAILFVSPSSTAVDRIALYMLPLQLVVFSSLPETRGPSSTNRSLIVLIVLYYAAVLFTWLNFAATSYTWIPYRFYPLT